MKDGKKLTKPTREGGRKARNETTGLTDIEGRFVAEYAVDVCQWKAMMRAHGSDDPTEKNWRQIAYQTMQRPQVKAAVEKLLGAQRKRLNTTAESVEMEIARLAMFDPAHVTGVGCPEDIAQLPEDVRRAIVGWSWDKNGNFTVKLAKESALEMLGRRHGMFREKVEHTGPGGGPIETKTTLDVSGLSMEQLRALASIRIPSE